MWDKKKQHRIQWETAVSALVVVLVGYTAKSHMHQLWDFDILSFSVKDFLWQSEENVAQPFYAIVLKMMSRLNTHKHTVVTHCVWVNYMFRQRLGRPAGHLPENIDITFTV